MAWGGGGCRLESKSHGRDERRDDGDLEASRVSQGRDMKGGGSWRAKMPLLQALLGVSFLTFPSSGNGFCKVKCGSK